MNPPAIHTLLVAAALLLTTTACENSGEAKAAQTRDDEQAAREGANVGGAGERIPADPAVDSAPSKPRTEIGDQVGGSTANVEVGAGGESGNRGPAAAEQAAGETEGGEDRPADKEPPKDSKPTPKVDGKPIFETKCKSCHGVDGKGDTTLGKKVNIPSLAETSLSKTEIISIVENGVPDTKMKSFKSKLSRAEIEAVAAYVKKL